MGAPHYKAGERWQDRLCCGTAYKYVRGCRCEQCRDAHSDYCYRNRTGRDRKHKDNYRRQKHDARSLSKREADRRSARVELFAIADELESTAARLQGAGLKAQFDSVMKVVVDVGKIASYI